MTKVIRKTLRNLDVGKTVALPATIEKSVGCCVDGEYRVSVVGTGGTEQYVLLMSKEIKFELPEEAIILGVDVATAGRDTTWYCLPKSEYEETDEHRSR